MSIAPPVQKDLILRGEMKEAFFRPRRPEQDDEADGDETENILLCRTQHRRYFWSRSGKVAGEVPWMEGNGGNGGGSWHTAVYHCLLAGC